MSGRACAGCGKAEAAMQCPKCTELGLPPTFFCEQTCFKKAWKTHKQVHEQTSPCEIESISKESQALFQFTGKLRPGKLSVRRTVPKVIPRPDYATHQEGISVSEELDKRRNAIPLCDEVQIAGIRKACRLSRQVLDLAGLAVRPGVTTDELDRIVHEAVIERNSYPSPLNYYGFPKSVCTSVNEIICHGIPDSRELEEGDIVNIDVSLFHEGYHADINETYFVGKNVSEDAVHIVKTAYECLQAAIAFCKPGELYRNCGDVIEAKALENKCSVVRTYCGHGVGSLFHTSPNIPHYAKNKAVGTMKKGHIFTLEPMINLGKWADVLWPDNWTSATQDGKLSAQFEETLLITDSGVEVLTARPDNLPPHFMIQMENIIVRPN